MSARHCDPRASDLERENQRLRRELAEKDRQIHRQTEEIAKQQQEIAEAEKQIADAERQIADLERQLALRKQNSTNSSKPPSSDGLAGGRRADSPAIAERIGPWSPSKESTKSSRSCRSNVNTAGMLWQRRSSKCRPSVRCNGIR